MVILAVAMAGPVTVIAGAPGSESLRVHLKHGRSMDATQYQVEGTTAHVSLSDGGSIAFPASLVERVETIRHEPLETAPVRGTLQQETVAAQAAEPGTMTPQPARAPSTQNTDPAVDEHSIDTLIRSAARRHAIEPDLLAAVIAVESGYDPTAVSPKGAQGLMQLMPGTARDLLVTNPFDPSQNIEAGAKYLRQLLDLHNGSFVDALAAYNAGRGRVARYNGVPPYRETIAYIGKVLKRYRTPQPVPAPHTTVSRAGR